MWGDIQAMNFIGIRIEKWAGDITRKVGTCYLEQWNYFILLGSSGINIYAAASSWTTDEPCSNQSLPLLWIRRKIL